MPLSRHTFAMSDNLHDRIVTHSKTAENDTIKDFIQRACVNQLEREGDFSIRDILEQEGINIEVNTAQEK